MLYSELNSCYFILLLIVINYLTVFTKALDSTNQWETDDDEEYENDENNYANEDVDTTSLQYGLRKFLLFFVNAKNKITVERGVVISCFHHSRNYYDC